jgi:hypothetical protein
MKQYGWYSENYAQRVGYWEVLCAYGASGFLHTITHQTDNPFVKPSQEPDLLYRGEFLGTPKWKGSKPTAPTTQRVFMPGTIQENPFAQCDMFEDFDFGTPGPVTVTHPLSELPCQTCGRMNDVGISTCWNCGGHP